MQCPSCQVARVPLRAKVLVAARASYECPACGATLRFQRLPRTVHTIFGDGMLLLGAAGALFLGAPILLLLSGGVWTVLALTLPLGATAARESHESSAPSHPKSDPD